MNITVDTFTGNKFINDFMHMGDVFERGKQLAEYVQLKVELNTNTPDIKKLLKNMKKGYESGNMNVVLLSVIAVNDVLLPQPRYLLEPNVQTISNGHQFGLFRDMLTKLGYKVITDEHMCVTDIRFEERL